MGLVGGGDGAGSDSALAPVAKLLYVLMIINIWLAVFNLIPVPPLDGSHVLRHFLSDTVRTAYDRIGIFALLALVFLAPGLLNILIDPPVNLYRFMLVKF
jgi:Zn-dependent protease